MEWFFYILFGTIAYFIVGIINYAMVTSIVVSLDQKKYADLSWLGKFTYFILVPATFGDMLFKPDDIAVKAITVVNNDGQHKQHKPTEDMLGWFVFGWPIHWLGKILLYIFIGGICIVDSIGISRMIKWLFETYTAAMFVREKKKDVTHSVPVPEISREEKRRVRIAELNTILPTLQEEKIQLEVEEECEGGLYRGRQAQK